MGIGRACFFCSYKIPGHLYRYHPKPVNPIHDT